MESAALYIRVSTNDQLEFSPNAQKKALLAYAKANNIFVDSENIFIDEGISGRSAEKRPAFMSMIGKAKIKPKPFDVILVHKFDRFARSREDSIIYKSMLLKQYNIRVISITENIGDDKLSIILESMLETLAEYYSINLSEEVKKGMTEKALRGESQACPAYGYKSVNKKLEVVPEEAEIVKYIFDQYLNHNKSFLDIAKTLNNRGIKTKKADFFERNLIEYILNNPVYVGKVRWTPTGKTLRNFNNPNTIISKSIHEPIISEEVFEKVQEKYKLYKMTAKPHARPCNEYKHWLSGLIHCSNCGAVLNYWANRKNPLFRCSWYIKGKCNATSSIAVSRVEKAVINEIKNTIDNFSNQNYVININIINKGKTEEEDLQKQIVKIKDKLQRAKEAFLAGVDTIEEYKQNKEMLIKQESELNSKLNEIINISEDKPKDYLDKLKTVYEVLIDNESSVEEKRNLIRGIVSKIVYDKKENKLSLFYFL